MPAPSVTGSRSAPPTVPGRVAVHRRRPRTSITSWVLAGFGLLAVAASAQGDPAAPAATFARGIEAYRANYCGACHALPAAGTEGAFGPSHEAMARTAAERLRDADYAGAAVTPEEYLRESIVDPAAYLVPGFLQSTHPMPAFTHLAEEDLDALVTMLLSQ